jgi:molybdopterin converting factor small subunit
MIIKIEVRLFATLRNNRFKKDVKEFDEGTTPNVILKDLDIDYEDVAILLINGRDGLLDTVLEDGDTLSVFPPVGGG